MTTHRIGYAYQTSPTAAALGHKTTGCYFLASRGRKISAHPTFKAARNAAAALGTEPESGSMDHPSMMLLAPTSAADSPLW